MMPSRRCVAPSLRLDSPDRSMALSCKHRQPAPRHSGITTQRTIESLHRCRTGAHRRFWDFLHISGGLHSFCIFELGFAIFKDELPQSFVLYTKLHYSRIDFGQPVPESHPWFHMSCLHENFVLCGHPERFPLKCGTLLQCATSPNDHFFLGC